MELLQVCPKSVLAPKVVHSTAFPQFGLRNVLNTQKDTPLLPIKRRLITFPRLEWRTRPVRIYAINYSSEEPKPLNFVLPKFSLEDYTLKKAIVLKTSLDNVFPLKESVNIREAMRVVVYPILCFAACELVGGNEAQAIPMACAVEMILLMSLTLDDLPSMDNDHLHRGLPRNHMGFNDFLSRAFEQIGTNTTDVPPHLIVRAIAEFCSAVGLEGLIGGHIDGLNCEGKQLKLHELEDMHIKKTSKLLEAAAVCGAIIGGGSDAEVEKVRSYARCIGLLLVVVDDIIVRENREQVAEAGLNKLIFSEK